MATILPASTLTVEKDDISLDRLCFEYATLRLGNIQKAGKLRGYMEAVLEANPGLADLGAVLPLGTRVQMPEWTITGAQPIARLWD